METIRNTLTMSNPDDILRVSLHFAGPREYYQTGMIGDGLPYMILKKMLDVTYHQKIKDLLRSDPGYSELFYGSPAVYGRGDLDFRTYARLGQVESVDLYPIESATIIKSPDFMPPMPD